MANIISFSVGVAIGKIKFDGWGVTLQIKLKSNLIIKTIGITLGLHC